MAFICEFCVKTFGRKQTLTRHKKNCEKNPSKIGSIYGCDNCDSSFKRADVFKRHLKSCGVKRRKVEVHRIECADCDIRVEQRHYAAHIRSNQHKMNCKQQDQIEDGVVKLKTCFKSRVCSFRISDDKKHYILPEDFMKAISLKVLRLMRFNLEQLGLYKINFEMFADYMKIKPQESDKEEDAKEIEETKSFNTKNVIITSTSDIGEIFSQVIETIKTKTEEFQERDSGWTIIKIRYLEVNFNKYEPISGSTYIKLPKIIASKTACVNVENKDNACFGWAVVSALYPSEVNSNRTSSYPHFDTVLNFKDTSFPMKVTEISIFERNNADISINVYGFENGEIVGPYYLTPCKKSNHVNLLLIESGDKSHYCWIKNLSRLTSKQVSKHDGRIWFCDGCLLRFRTLKSYERHSSLECNKVVTILPNPGDNILKFKNHENKLTVPFVIYADFECILNPIDYCEPNAMRSFTVATFEHIPYSFAYYVKCSYDDSLSKFVTYRGEDCMKVFNKYLKRDAIEISKIYSLIIPMQPLTFQQLQDFELAQTCFICKGELAADKVRDHCHLTGQFRGAAHNACNLNFKIPKYLPVILHNLSGYDSHFIVKTFGLEGNEKIDLIAQNKEKYISFTKYIQDDGEGVIKLRFIDSFRFMPSSLEKLASNLTSDQFECVYKYFPRSKERELMCKKQIFPYEFITSFESLKEPQLPPKSTFYSTLTKSDISDADYAHAETIWKHFGINTLGEYSDLYLKIDVLLLADVFENFRKVCREVYELDPGHYYTAPGLSWDAMLKYTKIEMELLTDYEMFKFIQRGIKGGLSVCSKRISQAFNKYTDGFDSSKESKFIVYLDANNQYGWAMSQYMPYNEFRWLEKEEIEGIDFTKISLTNEKGYFLEVDLDYSTTLHDAHNDLPFCPNTVIPPGSKTPKLIANLEPKERYVIHYRNLQQCLENGLGLIQIHRVIEFSQKPWLKQYIDLNTKLRSEAKNTFEKDFYKLMNNAVFGKTMENIDKRVDLKLVTKWESNQLGARKLINKPNFHSSSIIHENLLVIQLNRCKVTYNKPIYVGFSVLDISKTLMYDFHYQYIRPKYESNAKLLYTDTDSFIYELKTDDFYADIRNDLERFDTSDLPPDNVYGLPLVNKKQLGKMKDELNGEIILQFCGLRSKCYSIRRQDGKEIKKIKGIKRSVVANEITCDDYVRCFKNEVPVLYKTQSVFKSIKHQVFTQIMNKVALNNNDDKRFIIPNDPSGSTLAWGHKDIDSYYFI